MNCKVSNLSKWIKHRTIIYVYMMMWQFKRVPTVKERWVLQESSSIFCYKNNGNFVCLLVCFQIQPNSPPCKILCNQFLKDIRYYLRNWDHFLLSAKTGDPTFRIHLNHILPTLTVFWFLMVLGLFFNLHNMPQVGHTPIFFQSSKAPE